MRIAVVEDERRLAESLKEGLEAEGYVVSNFYDGESAERELVAQPPELVLLDLMLPRKSGVEVCRDIRKHRLMMPVLVLTARDEVANKVEALDAGADDFVTKPFSFEELLARLRALSRRPHVGGTIYKIFDLTLDTNTYRVSRAGKEVQLTHKEFEILRYLLEHRALAKTREDIYRHVWQREDRDFGNVVDVHIRHLREKIDDAHAQKIIRTVRNVGYAVEG